MAAAALYAVEMHRQFDHLVTFYGNRIMMTTDGIALSNDGEVSVSRTR